MKNDIYFLCTLKSAFTADFFKSFFLLIFALVFYELSCESKNIL